MTVYYKRPSNRVSEGELVRVARNFRLHPDRIADLDEAAYRASRPVVPKTRKRKPQKGNNQP